MDALQVCQVNTVKYAVPLKVQRSTPLVLCINLPSVRLKAAETLMLRIQAQV